MRTLPEEKTMPIRNMLTALCVMTLSMCAASSSWAQPVGERDLAFSVYAGVMTDDDCITAISGQAGREDSSILAGAVGWTFYRPATRMWSLELEANVARHFGIQDHFEFNAPVLTFRWEHFPWDRRLDTSLAYGIGPSFATTTPEYERIRKGDSEPVMLFWHIEAAFGLPDSPWATIFRLHHRSTGYGMFAEDGGSNILSLGLRYEF
jgi:hypothetical protein